MASRRDELNAYIFAKKRTVAAFLQPTPSGTEEGAPRPLRAVLPGVVVGALILAGFGAWGMFKPVAPKGWDDVASHVVVGSDSTTRYVVLKTDGKVQLHPVLNFASAKLLLDPDKSSIVKVKESELDNGHIPRGPTIGIPYAPDRLPSAEEAKKQMEWAVCEQPGGNGKTTQKAVFLFSDRDPKLKKLHGSQALHSGQALYVEDKQGARYVVDPKGTKYLIGGPDLKKTSPSTYSLLLRTVFRDGAKPQRVTNDWLATFRDGKPITFPDIPGTVGADAGVPSLGEKANRVGMVLETSTGNAKQHYVVLKGKVERISQFVAKLLLASEDLDDLGQKNRPEQVRPSSFVSDEEEFYGDDYNWPDEIPAQANSVDPELGSSARDTSCSVLRGVSGKGDPKTATWAGRDFPATIPDGATSAYVTPGSGVLFRQVQGHQVKNGSVFLVTDTGLRYAVQSNNDSDARKSKIGAEPDDKSTANAAQQNPEEAKQRLGYKEVNPVPVPDTWSEFLPRGPRLDKNSARQPQGS
ncbi:type VII secretion protein EccB [Streptomyces coffeae]|uniref:Type VII secretion protein EccB n=1 Tax=Streptomyces coffeae TaxID=621382 RepID=A0ABS1NR99_9ACTN|nr:type VII secretion protein EccB [Streptomyces coffeae]MBL1102355.1 type VII secretion protein EccB [Streptomyces coffeae]